MSYQGAEAMKTNFKLALFLFNCVVVICLSSCEDNDLPTVIINKTNGAITASILAQGKDAEALPKNQLECVDCVTGLIIPEKRGGMDFLLKLSCSKNACYIRSNVDFMLSADSLSGILINENGDILNQFNEIPPGFYQFKLK